MPKEYAELSLYEFQTQYATPSELIDSSQNQQLKLVTTQSKEANPSLFVGKLTYPLQTAKCLRALSNLVGSRFYIPPAMLERILREADPVITTSHSMIRFEGFSSCCSSYARLDISEAGFEAENLVPGTTNVDFQSTMRAALAKIRVNDSLALRISQDEIEVDSGKESVIERKVKLPLRWIKGFSELQAQQLNAKQYFQLNRVETIRFLRQIPRTKSKEFTWISQQGKSIRFSPKASTNSFKLKGLERLRLIEELAPYCESLAVYADDNSSLSCWVLKLGALNYTLVLSAEPWRGFSGEGGLLKTLALDKENNIVAKVISTLKWQHKIQPDLLAKQLNETPQAIGNALAVIATRGLVGFDVANQCFFHRVLPFEKELIEKMHPRLQSARKLIEQKAVTLLTIKGQSNQKLSSSIKSGDINHHVTIEGENERCTCLWHAKHQGNRGPCKHILATYLMSEINEKKGI